MKTTFKIGAAVCFLLSAWGCAHSYFFVPEVAGDGAKQGKGGVIYSLPVEKPAFKMKLVSLNASQPKNRNTSANSSSTSTTPDRPYVGIRMSFIRLKEGSPCTPIYIDALEQLVRFPGKETSRTGLVHGGMHDRAKIEIGCKKEEAVELYFPIPLQYTSVEGFQFYSFDWKIHYGKENLILETARFDRHDTAPANNIGAADFYQDDFYPYDQMIEDPIWWEPFGFGPSF